MTKERPPVTIENALYKVLGKIGLERAGEITDRAGSYLHALTDPDKKERLTIEDAIKLDVEHMGAGGIGAPIFETYALMIGAARAERYADATQLAHLAVQVVKEGGDAHVALFDAARPDATSRDYRDTLRELEESARATERAICLVKQLVDREAQPP